MQGFAQPTARASSSLYGLNVRRRRRGRPVFAVQPAPAPGALHEVLHRESRGGRPDWELDLGPHPDHPNDAEPHHAHDPDVDSLQVLDPAPRDHSLDRGLVPDRVPVLELEAACAVEPSREAARPFIQVVSRDALRQEAHRELVSLEHLVGRRRLCGGGSGGGGGGRGRRQEEKVEEEGYTHFCVMERRRVATVVCRDDSENAERVLYNACIYE